MQQRFVILSGLRRAVRPPHGRSTGAFRFKQITPLSVAALLLLLALRAEAQAFPGSPAAPSSKEAKTAVTFLFPEQITIPAQKAAAVDLHFRVEDGLHINSHTPREKSLIPTNLAVVEEGGLKVSAVEFPPGADYAFDFDPKEKLSVYTGEFILHAHITAPAGDHLLQGALRYQACDARSCYPPRTIPVAVDVIAK